MLNELKRNYNEHPLKYGETPLYEDVHLLYIEKNMTYDEIAPLFGVKVCTVRNWVKKLGIVKPIELKVASIKRKTKEKYGTESYSKLAECKDKVKQANRKKFGTDYPAQNKDIMNKMKATNLSRYGTEVASRSEQVKDKTKQTCQERYGVDSYVQSNEFKEKAQATCIERFGVKIAAQCDEIKQKIVDTNMSKYGVPYGLMSDEVIQKRKLTCLSRWGTDNISTKHIDVETLALLNNKDRLLDFIDGFEIKDYKEIANILGISYDGLKKKLQEFDVWGTLDHKVTHAETELSQLLPAFHKTRQVIKPYEIDLYNEDYKLGIEFNGLYWHSELFKPKNYHQYKSTLANDNGVFLFHIFEHEWLDIRKKPILLSQINNLIGSNNKIMARKCKVVELSAKVTNDFLNQNHLQGEDHSSVRLGLCYEDMLVSVMTFCKPRFNKNYEWELSRFCSRLNYTVQGGASKLFSYFLREYSPNSIISYSNSSKTKGTLYQKLGFDFIQQTAPSYIWFKGVQVKSRYQCQKHKLDSSLGDTEDEIMHNQGYLKMYDCGNGVWSWQK